MKLFSLHETILYIWSKCMFTFFNWSRLYIHIYIYIFTYDQNFYSPFELKRPNLWHGMLLLSDGENQDATRALHSYGIRPCVVIRTCLSAWWHYAANMAVFDYISAGFPTFFFVSRFMKDFFRSPAGPFLPRCPSCRWIPKMLLCSSSTYRTTRLQHWFLVFTRFCWAWEEVSCDSRRGYPIYRHSVKLANRHFSVFLIYINQLVSTCQRSTYHRLALGRKSCIITYYILLLLICWTNLQLSGWFSIGFLISFCCRSSNGIFTRQQTRLGTETNHSDLKHDRFTPQKVAEERKSSYFWGNLGWWNIIIWLDSYLQFVENC